MSGYKKQVLIVDDSTDDIQFLMQNLKQDYAVIVATSGAKGIEQALKEPHPDVILLDVEMPDMNGYETCRKLKEDPAIKDIDVIFISAHDTTEEKLAGYDAGGSDYLIKPVQPEELSHKVKLSIHNTELHKANVAEKSLAFETAMTAMTSAGEQGNVLEFFQNCFTLDRIENLAGLIVDHVNRFDLENTVQIRTIDGTITIGTRDPIPPIEAELLTRLSNKEKIISHGKRTIFNFGKISLLVKNTPDYDEKAGRLKDHIAILLEGASTRLISIEREVEQKQLQAAIMDRVLITIEEFFLSFGLTPDQEEKIIEVIENAVGQTLEQK